MLKVFLNETRGHKAVCVLEQPDIEKDKNILLLFCHGFVGHKITPHRMMPNLSRTLKELGITTLRMDCIGAGDSEGGPEYMTISGEVEDYLNLYSAHIKQKNWDKLILLGYSMGGTIASLLSSQLSCDSIILWSPVSNPYWNFYHILGAENFKKGLAGQSIQFDGDYVHNNFFNELDFINPLENIKNYRKNIFIIHGTDDKDVLPINALAYYKVCQNAKIHFVEGADHTYSHTDYQEELISKTKDYIIEILKGD